MEVKEYDTVEGISRHITSLEGLHRVVKARHKAYYERKERLDGFCVLGRFVMDTCGNFAKFVGKSSPIELCPDMPAVVPMDILWAVYLPKDVLMSWEHGSCLPYLEIPCEACGEKWSIDNVHDVHIDSNHEVIALKEFSGKTLMEMCQNFASRNDALYHMYLTANPESIRTTRGLWRSVGEEYVIKDDDEGFFYVWRFYHPACKQRVVDKRVKENFQDIFAKAGFEILQMTAIENAYGSRSYRGPWFLINTDIGRVVIGWRKNVIEITWDEEEGPRPALFEREFSLEKVTKGRGMIHAWSSDKAIEYLKVVRTLYF